MDSFRRKMIRGEWFEIASWKSSDSIKSDLPIKSEGRSLKGFTSSHFFFLPSRAKVSKKNGRLTRLRAKDGGRAATYRKVERSIDPSNSLAGANFAYMAAPTHRREGFLWRSIASRDTAINFFLVSRYALSLTVSFYINIFSITF